MYGDKSFLAVIPARGGSKGLPGKNIRPLMGKPLLHWSIEAAQECQYFDEIFVSTDCPEIAAVAEEGGCPVPELRPKELATDEATTVAVIHYILDFYKARGKEFDYLCLLEPTSPLREKGDLCQMIEKVVDGEELYDSLISVGEVHCEHPSIVKRIHGELIEPYVPELPQVSRRQDNPKAYFPYCVGYIVKTSAFLEQETFYTKRSGFYEIQRHQNYEIDDIYDFLTIEAILKHHAEEQK